MSKFVGLRIGAVHEVHTVSEYYCGGCGWPVTDHDSYCPECGGAFQESFADDALEAENAKLRELVCDMWRELAVACAEQVTSHETLRKVSDRMCELGIEVVE